MGVVTNYWIHFKPREQKIAINDQDALILFCDMLV